MNSMTLVIDGKPVPKMRPRLTRRGICYDPQEADKRKWKVLILKSLESTGWEKAKTEPLEISLDFGMQIPASLPKKARDRLVGAYHCKRPDIDNLVKFVLDCMISTVYDDDSIIYSMSAVKHYASQPYVQITVSKV